MEKLTIGRKRKTDIKNDSSVHYPELLAAIGLSTMCIMLMLSIISAAGSSSAKTDSTSDVVAVMSSAVEETVEKKREELVMPDKKASAMEDESLFETIGKFFADLILSEG